MKNKTLRKQLILRAQRQGVPRNRKDYQVKMLDGRIFFFPDYRSTTDFKIRFCPRSFLKFCAIIFFCSNILTVETQKIFEVRIVATGLYAKSN